MKNCLNRSFRIGSLAIIGFGLLACQTDRHTMVEPAPGTTIVCRECYDEVAKVRLMHVRTNRIETETFVTHRCEGCKAGMSIYGESGVLMVKCARCAPDGLPCDKCLPPEASAK
jgi:hypothetical protein